MTGYAKTVGRGLAIGLICAAATGAVAVAQAIEVEEAVLGDATVRLYLHPFLTSDELTTLRLVMTNEQALALFVPNADGFAALAAAPAEGVIREGQPVASAIALAELPDAAAASKAATAACDQAKAGGEPCVVVLEVAPAQ